LASLATLLALGLSWGGILPAQADDSSAPGGTVSGTVTLDGVPTGGLKVCGGSDGCVFTAADGTYTATNVEASSMACLTIMPATSEQEKLFPVTSIPKRTRAACGYFELAAGQMLTDMNISVVSFPLVRGQVTDESGTPIAGAAVSGGQNQDTTTDAQGNYVVRVTTGVYDGGTVTASYAGYTDGVRQVMTSADGVTVVLTSLTPGASTTTITAAKPGIVGKAKVRRTLRVVPGSWGPAAVTLSYQWYRNGKKVTGATAASYRLTSRDRAKKITVGVTGAITGHSSITKKSAPTKKVAR
jgi:hypothetical protein